jgi:hypothetical protein
MLNIIYIYLLIMGYASISKQATCKVCGLTSRIKEELADHIRHAHESFDSKSFDKTKS